MFDFYPDYEPYFARVQLVLFMLGMGVTLRVQDFASVFLKPKYLFVGLLFHIVIAPVLAVLVNQVSGVPPGIAVGLILIALMPGGTLSKVFTHLGRGNFALTISLTVMTTLAAIVTVPLLLGWLAVGFITDPQALERFQMPVGDVMEEIGLFLLVPMLAGMSLGRFASTWRLTFSKWCVRVGWLVVVVMVVSSLGSGRIKPGEYGWRAPLAIIAFCLLCQQGSMFLFRFRPWPRPDRLSIGIEATMRNMNLALLIKASVFPDRSGPDALADGVLFTILFYAAAAMCAGFPLAMNHRRMARRERAQVQAASTV